MKTTKTIAIVGATEKAGRDLAIRLGKAGDFRLLLMSTDEAGIGNLKAELEKQRPAQEVIAIGCAREASWEADIIVIASSGETKQEAEKIRQVAVGKIVIHLSMLNEPGDKLRGGVRTALAAETFQGLLPDSMVVGVYPMPTTASAFITGNNGDAVDAVSAIIAAAGFEPIVAGDLAAGRTVDPPNPEGQGRLIDHLGFGRIDLRQVLSYLRSMTRASR